MLHTSKHLCIQEKDGNYVVYNTLFGNLTILSASQYNYLLHEEIADDNKDTTIQLLKENFFLLPEGLEERDIIKKSREDRTSNLTSGYLVSGLQLVLTNHCNFRCTYCFSGELQENNFSCRSPQDRMSPEMAVDIVNKTIKLIKSNGNSHLTIEFFGGEPLLNWPAIEAVIDTFKDGEKYSIQIYYTITTNGSPITDYIAHKFSVHNVHTVLSYDTPGNHYRVTSTHKPAEPLIIKGLDRLLKFKCSVSFNSVISNINLDKFSPEKLLETAAKYNIKTIALILDLSSHPYSDTTLTKNLEDKLIYTKSLSRKFGINITGYWHQIFEQIIDMRPINLLKGYKTCPAEGCKISVEPNGDISNCKCVEHKIGHISNLEAVFKTNRYLQYSLKAYETTPFCNGCRIEGFCSGLCMGTLDAQHHDISALVPNLCNLYINITNRLIHEHMDCNTKENSLVS